MDRRPGQGAVDRRQVGLPLEHDIGGVLALIHAPVILDAEVAMDGAVGAGKLVELAVETFHLQAVGQLLRPLPIGDLDEAIVHEFVRNVPPAQLGSQPVVAVEVDLQPAGQPCRHSHVAEPQFVVDEIEVVVQTLAIVRPQEGLAGVLVVPGLVGRTRLHHREDAYQSWLLSAFRHDLLYPVFLSHVTLAEKFDLESAGRCHPFGVLAQLIAKWFRKLRIVEDADLPLV